MLHKIWRYFNELMLKKEELSKILAIPFAFMKGILYLLF